MRQDFEKLFTNISSPRPAEELLDKVMNRIQKERVFLALRRKLVIFFASTLCSAVALVGALRLAGRGFAESGFFKFFSLLFSDFGSVYAYWQDFAWSLLESLPVMGLIILLAAVLALLISLRLFVRGIIIYGEQKYQYQK
ncbi:hypothetical protein EPN28_03445 [Patescibacteria group bacterium]|nr:MAG: hypothetical protein EPN28_03445 [Patescibacteria group bacterium]